MTEIAHHLQEIEARIQSTCEKYARSRSEITLLAVSKKQAASSVRQAYKAGQTAFGENYLQEAIEKIEALADIRQELQWHLIGPLQSNKTRLAAEHFDWVQSIDRLKIAQRLSEQRPENLPHLNICIQVNISGEASKSGVSPEDLEGLCQEVIKLPRLNLRGLMAIPEPGHASLSLQAMRDLFNKMRESLRQSSRQSSIDFNFDTLSMGMSGDLEEAIASGSTMVRIGTAIFGVRAPK